MNRKKLFQYSGLLIFFIFVIDFLADKFFLYYSVWYLDIIMHFLGGVWLALMALWFFSGEFAQNLKPPIHFVFKILLFVFLFGVGWEIFEFIFNNHINQNPFNVSDTLSDIFFDLSGGAFVVLYFFKKIRYNQEHGENS